MVFLLQVSAQLRPVHICTDLQQARNETVLSNLLRLLGEC